jgi:hypothetical protein
VVLLQKNKGKLKIGNFCDIIDNGTVNGRAMDANARAKAVTFIARILS